MKLRDKTNIEICEENKLPYTILTNVVEEKNSKNKMRATSALIAKALIATLGPYGSSTIIESNDTHHFATKDGYDLINKMSFEDEVSRTILDLFRVTSSNQVLSVGDGSTSAIVVANALFQALTDPKQVENFKRIAPKDINDILNDLSEMIETELKKMAVPISSDMKELDTIAAIANNNDYEAGKFIGDIYRKIGKYGFITMDFNDKKNKDSYETKSGIEWNFGYPDFIYGKDYDDGKVVYEQNPRVIISNSTLSYDDIETVLIPLMQCALNNENAELVIVANDFDEDVLNFFKINRTKHLKIGDKSVPMIFTPTSMDLVTAESKNRLEDLALICNCKIYDKFVTKKAEIIANPALYVGKASKAIISKKFTQIVAEDSLTSEHKKIIDSKIKELKKSIEELTSNDELSSEDEMKLYNLRTRCSRLSSSAAIVHVGGKTFTERKTRSRLMEDSIFACKSALEYGYIPGGNICIPKILKSNKSAFVSILAKKYNYLPIENIRTFFFYFIDILCNAFLESYRAVLNNSYMSEAETEKTIERCLTNNEFYNLKLHRFENWKDTTVINSVNTDIEILKTCLSIIGILSTSNQFMTINFDVTGQIKN